MSLMTSPIEHVCPTRPVRISCRTGFGEAKIAASTRPIHSRQRRSGGRSASSRSNGSGAALVRRAMSQAVEARGRAPGQLARGAERDQTLEQAAQRTVGHGGEARGGGHGVVGGKGRDDPRVLFGAQPWCDRQKNLRAPIELERKIVGAGGCVRVGEMAGGCPVWIGWARPSLRKAAAQRRVGKPAARSGRGPPSQAVAL